MPLARVPGQPLDTLVGHADGRRWRSCLRSPAMRSISVILTVLVLSACATRSTTSQKAKGGLS